MKRRKFKGVSPKRVAQALAKLSIPEPTPALEETLAPAVARDESPADAPAPVRTRRRTKTVVAKEV